MSDDGSVTHVTYKHGRTIGVHRYGCERLGQHNRARYSRALRERNDPAYDFHGSFEAALRFAHVRGCTDVKACSRCL